MIGARVLIVPEEGPPLRGMIRADAGDWGGALGAAWIIDLDTPARVPCIRCGAGHAVEVTQIFASKAITHMES